MKQRKGRRDRKQRNKRMHIGNDRASEPGSGELSPPEAQDRSGQEPPGDRTDGGAGALPRTTRHAARIQLAETVAESQLDPERWRKYQASRIPPKTHRLTSAHFCVTLESCPRKQQCQPLLQPTATMESRLTLRTHMNRAPCSPMRPSPPLSINSWRKVSVMRTSLCPALPGTRSSLLPMISTRRQPTSPTTCDGS